MSHYTLPDWDAWDGAPNVERYGKLESNHLIGLKARFLGELRTVGGVSDRDVAAIRKRLDLIDALLKVRKIVIGRCSDV